MSSGNRMERPLRKVDPEVAQAIDREVNRQATGLELIASEDKEFHVVPGGHAGAFGGSKSFTNTWPMTIEWLSTRSD